MNIKLPIVPLTCPHRSKSLQLQHFHLTPAQSKLDSLSQPSQVHLNLRQAVRSINRPAAISCLRPFPISLLQQDALELNFYLSISSMLAIAQGRNAEWVRNHLPGLFAEPAFVRIQPNPLVQFCSGADGRTAVRPEVACVRTDGLI